MSESIKVKASSHESYNTLTLISFVFPMVGIILGIVFFAKDTKQDRKLGEHLIAISILFMIIWYFIWSLYVGMTLESMNTPALDYSLYE